MTVTSTFMKTSNAFQRDPVCRQEGRIKQEMIQPARYSSVCVCECVLVCVCVCVCVCVEVEGGKGARDGLLHLKEAEAAGGWGCVGVWGGVGVWGCLLRC